MSYSRYILVMLLVVYLILVWMYFKDNALQLTSSNLLLWFVVVPLMLLGSIMAIRWMQKKMENKTGNIPDIAVEQENTKLPNSYRLFMYSSVCLPEGDSWSEVIDNDADLTLLSEDLTDFDGLPILIKPITKLADAASLPYEYMHDVYLENSLENSDFLEDSDFDDDSLNQAFDNETFDEESHTRRVTDLNSITLRLCSLIHEQLSLSDEILSSIAEHFNSHYQPDSQGPNSAINIHPEWQQHYLISADNENNDEPTTTFPDASLSKLPIYLCIPDGADSSLLIVAIKEQLATYGISESLISITPIITNDTDAADDNANNHEIYDPINFINEHVMPLSQSASPELCLLIIVDSQINDAWLESQLHSSNTSNVIPTEAGVLLVFCNQAAQDVLDIDTNASFLLTEICTPNVKDEDVKNSDPKDSISKKSMAENNDVNANSNFNNSLTNKRSYLNNLTVIKNLLIDNSLSLAPTNKTELQATKKTTAVITDTASKYFTTKVLPSDISITVLSDINPLNQPYDMSLLMNFIDAFIAHGALVNERHLGHYMPLSTWLKPFISLSLLINLASEGQQESDSIFLITQHKQCSMLWLADYDQTP
ncbi:hypothetical protein AK825_04065 [Psychrobacter sp. P11G5]|nr:hypothetical protein AK825_04065 [Psychrobacter sp. P11G5]